MKFKLKNILKVIFIILVFIIVVKIYNSIKLDIMVLKDKETLITSIKKDEDILNELILYLKELDVSIIGKKNEKGVDTIYYGYKTYKNDKLNYIFEKYKLMTIGSTSELISFDISKDRKGITYWGFYYSEDKMPHGNYGDVLDDTFKDGNGYRESINYNYYTELIVGNWYYYEIYWYHGL